MTPGSHSSRDDWAGDDGRVRPDADRTLHGFAARHDDLLQQRAVVLARVHGVDAEEIFALTRAGTGLRWDELATAPEADRLAVLWLLLARHARTLSRRRAAPPTGPVPRGGPAEDHSHADRAALAAVGDLTPRWRHLDGRAALDAPETAVFRAMAHLEGPPRDVLVLFWLGVGADDVAEELRMSRPTVLDVLREARLQLRRVLDAGAVT